LKPDRQLEIAHVLFIDIVGYSKLPIEQQSDLQNKLNQIVRSTEQFRSADAVGKLMRLPTGDGMALAFFTSPDAPVRCALEINQSARSCPQLKLRMGIHSGPVDAVSDINDKSNVAGAGINTAQRVMDCGDAGHILLSRRVADDLGQYEQWQPLLHELGEVQVKHGGKIDIVNLFGEGIGNAGVPERIAQRQQALDRRSRMKGRFIVIGSLIAAAAIGLSILAYWNTRAGKSAGSTSGKSVAVLPFENLSRDPDNAFFASGIQDEILSQLAKIAALKVISRTSTRQYETKPGNLSKIGEQLGVGHILEGSVQRAADKVRVTVQLIDASTDAHVWAETYDRKLTDVFKVESEIATEVAAALRARLEPQERANVEAQPTSNPEAYLLYLRAREREQDVDRTTQDRIAAEQLYEQAIALDPTFAQAQARSSITNSYIFLQSRNEMSKAKARAQAEAAVRLSPTLGDAHLALGLYFVVIDKDYPAASREFSIAATASPNNSEILTRLAVIHRRLGRWRKSIASCQRALELDPRNARIAEELASTRLMVRDWPAAAADFERAMAIAPNSIDLRTSAAYLEVLRTGNPAAAKTLLAEIPGDPSSNGGSTLINWNVHMLARDFVAAQKVLDAYPSENLFPGELADPKAFYQACTALARGDRELAQHLFVEPQHIFEAEVRDHPEDPRRHAILGTIYAFMGRNQEAVREGREAVKLEPENKDAFHGAQIAAQLALIYARAGEADQAIALLGRLLSTPGADEIGSLASITLAQLRLGWQWGPLRSDARFQKILAGPEPKTTYN
jgi:TolB-like protein/class 3 adenylate cyclase/Tfp pilus assembly protein PilF